MNASTPGPRAARPVHGRDLLAGLPKSMFDRPIVVTQPEPWGVLHKRFGDNACVRMVSTMEHSEISALTAEMPDASTVFGIGGGMAADLAKFVAWKRSLPLVLMPSIVSVDAAFCAAIAVREGGRVRYIGAAVPDHLLIDFDLIQSAPPVLNRAGVGDIVSIFTALWDWREAGTRTGERYDPGAASEARGLLDRLFEGAGAIRDVTDDGIRLLSDLYVAEVRLCDMIGNSRLEEGSEHHIAYCVEALTKRPFLHGRLVALGVLLAGAHQGQDTAPVREFLNAIDLGISPAEVGLSCGELKTALRSIGGYLASEPSLNPGVFHFKGAPDDEAAEALIAGVE